MRLSFTLFLLFAAFVLVAQADDQDCFYQLQLRDSGGDGLNGGVVVVTVGTGDALEYTLDETNDDGSQRDFFFPVDNGDEVSLAYREGAFIEEVSFSILDNNDSLIYRVEAPTESDELTTFTAQCRTCAPPPLSSIELFRPRFNTVDLRFRGVGAAADPTYLIRYGEGDFDPTTDEGTELTTQDTLIRIGELTPQTDYTFFISTICADPADTTVRRGPFRVRTPIRRDLGITVLQSPITECADDGDGEVTVGITNFGGEPQQFVYLDFTVNGEESGVQTPFDGIFTGVVGVDSTEFFTFDTEADLSIPGEYTFELFTMLEEDENFSNDTLTATVLSVPVISDFPYVENFEQGSGFWRGERAGSGPQTWRRGRPRGSFIDRAASGEFAFATNPRGDYSNGELSYLRSPCFSFAGLQEDPVLSFNLYVDTEENFDRVYLEASTDDGENWEVLERNPTSINWYNNGLDQAWDGDGGFGDRYAAVATQLEGFAGEADVQLRFVFESDGDGTRDGVAVDDIRLALPAQVDLAAVDATAVVNATDCPGTIDTLNFTFASLGDVQPDSVTVNYRVPGTTIVSERVAAPAVRGNRMVVTIAPTSLNYTPPGEVVVELWVEAEDDTNPRNDTTTLVFQPTLPLPFLVDFENGRTPRNWQLDDDLVIGDRGQDLTTTLFDNLSDSDSTASFTTSSYGPFEANDSLVMDVAVTADGATGDTVGVVDVSFAADCNETLFATDTVPLVVGRQRIALPVGSGGTGSFTVTARLTGEEDFTIDFDNIGVKRCPASLDVAFTIDPPSGAFADDGVAYLSPRQGTAPFIYDWSTGDATQSVDSLSVQDYEVTVTDALGCSQTLTVPVTLDAIDLTDTDEAGELANGVDVFPNPTSGRVEVALEISQALPISLEVYDARGRQLERRDFGRQSVLSTTIDLSNWPAGLYFLRLRAGEQSRTLRLVRG